MESWTHAAANLLSMMPGANAGITMNATAMSAASMRPDANRRDHPAASATSSAGPALRAGITPSAYPRRVHDRRSFNEARREAPGSHQAPTRAECTTDAASMRPGAKRRDHSAFACAAPTWRPRFNEARREAPGSPGGLCDLIRWPGASRRDHPGDRAAPGCRRACFNEAQREAPGSTVRGTVTVLPIADSLQ